MLWETWIENVSMALSVSTTEAGIILSFIATVFVIVLVAVATRGEKIEILAPIMTLLSVLFFVYIGWFPTLLGSILAFIMALFSGLALFGGA